MTGPRIFYYFFYYLFINEYFLHSISCESLILRNLRNDESRVVNQYPITWKDRLISDPKRVFLTGAQKNCVQHLKVKYILVNRRFLNNKLLCVSTLLFSSLLGLVFRSFRFCYSTTIGDVDTFTIDYLNKIMIFLTVDVFIITTKRNIIMFLFYNH